MTLMCANALGLQCYSHILELRPSHMLVTGAIYHHSNSVWVHQVSLGTVGCSVGYALHQQTPLMHVMPSTLLLLVSELYRIST